MEKSVENCRYNPEEKQWKGCVEVWYNAWTRK